MSRLLREEIGVVSKHSTFGAEDRVEKLRCLGENAEKLKR